MDLSTATRPITRRSLHSELLDHIRELIVEGVLPPGSKIPENELCARFGVSRTPMREALKVLAADGLVMLEQNRGAWVSKITVAELEEVFPVMGALEALSGELACQNITPAQLENVRHLHAEMVRHYESKELAEYFRVNQEIHEVILEAANNATLAAQYRSLAHRVRRARYIANMTDARWRRAVEEHEQILKALENREGEKLAGILKAHLHNKLETVRQWLEDDQSGN